MGPENILLIEDDPGDAEIVRRMLAKCGDEYSLRHADSLFSAFMLFSAGPFDAVLLDLNLPDSKGLGTVFNVQEKASRSALIVLTGLDDEKIGASSLQSGAQDYLVKGSFKAEALCKALRHAISRKKLQLRLKKSEELSGDRNRIYDLIGSTLDFELIMERAIGEAARSVGAETTLIGLYEKGGFRVKYSYGPLAGLRGLFLEGDEMKALAVVRERGVTITTVDSRDDPRFNQQTVKRFGLRAAAIFPLHMRGSVRGAMVVFNLSPRTFDDLEIASAKKISVSLSFALENAELYEECRQAREDLDKRSAELERSNRDLEQFASVASHDLQEPLVSLASALKLSMRRLSGMADEETMGFLGDAVSGAENMQKMVRSLLAYSKIGRQPSFEDADMGEVLELTLKALKSSIEKADAVVTKGPLPRLKVDPVLVGEIFQNLIGNAIKYRSDKPPEIHISAEKKEDGYVFCVGDNGLGIPAEHFESVFEIFRRVHGKRAGHGIGLAACKKIAEIHGGKIWVESEEGKGSKFYFSFPVSHEGASIPESAR